MSATIELSNGLGIQLFQIFTLISYCIKSKKSIYFEENSSESDECIKYYWDTPLLNKLKKYIKPSKNTKIILEDNFDYNPINIYHTDEDLKLYGYFQSYKYFDLYKDLILGMLNLNDVYASIHQKISLSIFNNPVSIQFHIGDFINNKNVHITPPNSYYNNALTDILLNNYIKPDADILCFYDSNNINYAIENINYLKKNTLFNNLNFIHIPNNLDEYEYIILISQCKYNIIGPSTNGWWGAYLGCGNKVYYPSSWFNCKSYYKTPDLFPSSWHKVTI